MCEKCLCAGQCNLPITDYQCVCHVMSCDICSVVFCARISLYRVSYRGGGRYTEIPPKNFNICHNCLNSYNRVYKQHSNEVQY